MNTGIRNFTIFNFLTLIILILISILNNNLVFAQEERETGVCTGENCYNRDNPPTSAAEMQQLVITSVPPNFVAQHPDWLSPEQRSQLSQQQLQEIIKQNSPQALGDLGQYDSVALAQALQSQGYDVSRLGGNIAGARFEGNTLVIGNSHFDAKTGKPFFSDN